MDEDALRVLLVEDDEAVAEMYRIRLEVDGYDVAVAHDGESGLREALAAPPDLMYLDIRLPRIDGLEVLRRLRRDARGATVPVILISNYSEPELIATGLKLGALDYLVKAETSPGQLSRKVKEWMATEEHSAV